MKGKDKIETLENLYQSDGFQMFDNDRRGNSMFLNDPNRAERCYDAAENGSDGSTHAEIIQDWRDYLDTLRIIDSEYPEDGGDITQAIYDSISAEIDSCEEWHERNKSLNTQLG